MNQTPQTIPTEIYGVFCGNIEQVTVQRIFTGVTAAIHGNVKHLHLLFQSTGGYVGDGVCLYNFFKAIPIDFTLYNVGTVSSIAVVAYLGAKERRASTHATFMVHRSHFSLPMATADRLQHAANSLRLDDNRTEMILKDHIKTADAKWLTAEAPELWFTAKEAVESGLATGIGEFAPPPGSLLYNI